jgi:hypothetical protein
LCVQDDDDSGTELLDFDLSRDPAILGGKLDSPSSENYLFSCVGLIFEDLNNKGVVVFTVK